MRALSIIISLLAALLPAGVLAQPVFEDPVGLIEYAYAPYESDQFPEDITELFSPTLKQLWDKSVERSEEMEMPIIDFDPFTNAQDYQISDLVVADPVIAGDEATVVVSFLNFSEPQELHFSLVRRAEGWKIDDIESLAGEYTWRLSELLAADPMLN
jgi:hypothetical protein